MSEPAGVLEPRSEPCDPGADEVAQLSAGGLDERVDAWFAGEARCIRDARRFVNEQLVDRRSSVIRDVVLMVSELATNCVKHAHSAFSVSLTSNRDGVCVEVGDDGKGTPTRQSPDPERGSGRGLQIVDELADSWGVTPKVHQGKTVWFAIDGAPLT